MQRARWLETRTFDRDTIALAIVLAIGTVLRVALMLGSSGILWADSYSFYLSAESLRAGDVFSHDAFKTPLYHAFLALFMTMGETPAMGALLIGVQHLLGLIATAVFYRIARQLFTTPVAFISSLLFTGHTLLLFYETSVLSEVLFVFFLSLLLHQSVHVLQSSRGSAPAPAMWRYALIGGLAALATLTRPVSESFVFCIAAIIIIAGRLSRRSIGAAALAVGVYCAAMAPWLYVNSQTYGFWGVSLGRGLGLFIRVFEIDKLEPRPDTRYEVVRDVLGWARARGRNISYVVRDELNFRHGHSSESADAAMFGFAFETVRAQPWLYVRNSAWSWVHQLVLERQDPEICRARGVPYLCTSSGLEMSTAMFPNVPPPGHRWVKREIAAWFRTAYIRMWLVVPLAFVGVLWLAFPRVRVAGQTSRAAPSAAIGSVSMPAVILLIVAIVYFTAIPALMQFPEERYRLPVDALLFMFAASCVHHVFESTHSARAFASSAWARAFGCESKMLAWVSKVFRRSFRSSTSRRS